MIINVTGKIVSCLEKRSGVSKNTGKEWVSQDYVIEDAEGKILCFNVFGEDNISRYNLMVGTSASITCDLESREWNGKYFTSLRCTQCFTEQNNQVSNQSTQQQAATKKTDNAPQSNSDIDSLPF